MYRFEKLTSINGIDESSLDNARQNNYAWSMAELNDYIYVGTGRNVLAHILESVLPDINIPQILRGNTTDDTAEIWRYKNDGSLPWQRVFKVNPEDYIAGFRYMINHKDIGGATALYASGVGIKVTVHKSRNGVTWYPVDNSNLEGTSSRAMVSLNGKLYLATMTDNIIGGSGIFLYSSDDPEFYPWKLETPTGEEPGCPKLIPGKNPVGAINGMIVFNNKIYLCCSTEDNGLAIWRTNGSEPKVNDWTLVVDKGFGDYANESSLGMGIFNDMLYVSATKSLPLAWALPIGTDIIRINKNDQWQLVVGGKPIKPSEPTRGKREEPISGLTSGFGNLFNVYAWQFIEHKGRLLVSTIDASSNMEITRDLLLYNIDFFERYADRKVIYSIAKGYEAIIALLDKIKYPIGFDLYESEDGERFRSVSLDGFGNRDNYGGRKLMVDSKNNLYVGTANPFQGCEIWKESIKEAYNKDCVDKYNYNQYSKYGYIEKYKCLEDNKSEFDKIYNKIWSHILYIYERLLEER